MSQTSKVNPQSRIDIMRVIAQNVSPVTNDKIAYELGMCLKTVQETTQKMFNSGELQRAKLQGTRGWQYFVAEVAKVDAMKSEGFAGTAPQSAMPQSTGAAA